MNPTLDDIIDSFKAFLESVEDDTVNPEPDILYLEAVVKELEAVQTGYANTEMEEFALQAASIRIPGLLHLYKVLSLIHI